MYGLLILPAFIAGVIAGFLIIPIIHMSYLIGQCLIYGRNIEMTRAEVKELRKKLTEKEVVSEDFKQETK